MLLDFSATCLCRPSSLRHILWVALLAILVTVSAAYGEQPSQKAFIANAGGDFGHGSLFGVVEAGQAERAYNEFFAGMKNWGSFEIVANPARADWVFEVSAHSHESCVEERYRDIPRQVPVMDYWIKVTMLEAKSLEIRKEFTEYVKPAGYFASPAKNFDRAMAALLDDVKKAFGDQPGKTSLEIPGEPLAPVPPRIGAAQTVLIQNVTGNDSSGNKYSGGPAGALNRLSTAMRSWGRYQLVSSAADADLIFQVAFSVEPQCAGAGDPQLQLTILDSRTDALLWAFTTHVPYALLAENARKNFAQGIEGLVSQVREISGRSTWAMTATVAASAPPPVFYTVSDAASAAPISVSVSALISIVKPGSDVGVKVTVKNSSKEAIKFTYPSGDPITCLLTVRDASGKEVAESEQGRKLKTDHLSWQGRPLSYTLNPGESQTRLCTVSDLYDLAAPGKYSIAVQQLDGRPTQSNTVEITVTP